jgi:protein gp37
MSDSTTIEWANHTGGPYLGCSMVSPGCIHCYAMDLAMTRLERIFRKAYKLAGFTDWEMRPVWGDKATRVLSKGFWNDARRINAEHAKAGTRGRWFPSMIDWLDTMPGGIIDQDGKQLDPIEVLADFLNLIAETPELDWLLLTKRPELCFDRVNLATRAKNYRADGRLWNLAGCVPHNVWLGVSVEDQQRANERIPALLKIPAKVRFLSCEPLLGPVDLTDIVSGSPEQHGGEHHFNCLSLEDDNPLDDEEYKGALIDWVIGGGESGKQARRCEIKWLRSLKDQCEEAGVDYFLKQLGGNLSDADLSECAIASGKSMHHPKGGDPEEWCPDLRVREFPSV